MTILQKIITADLLCTLEYMNGGRSILGSTVSAKCLLKYPLLVLRRRGTERRLEPRGSEAWWPPGALRPPPPLFCTLTHTYKTDCDTFWWLTGGSGRCDIICTLYGFINKTLYLAFNVSSVSNCLLYLFKIRKVKSFPIKTIYLVCISVCLYVYVGEVWIKVLFSKPILKAIPMTWW